MPQLQSSYGLPQITPTRPQAKPIEQRQSASAPVAIINAFQNAGRALSNPTTLFIITAMLCPTTSAETAEQNTSNSNSDGIVIGIFALILVISFVAGFYEGAKPLEQRK